MRNGQWQKRSINSFSQSLNSTQWRRRNWSHPFIKDQKSYEPLEEELQKSSNNSRPLDKGKFLEKKLMQFWKKHLKVPNDWQTSLGHKKQDKEAIKALKLIVINDKLDVLLSISLRKAREHDEESLVTRGSKRIKVKKDQALNISNLNGLTTEEKVLKLAKYL